MSDADAWPRAEEWPRRATAGTWVWRVVLTLAAVGLIAVVWAAIHYAQLSASTVQPDVPPPAAPVASPESAAPPASDTQQPSSATGIVADPAWTERTAALTGIPARALHAYATAALIIGAEQPSCGIGWNTLAGIGAIESAHGSHGGAVLRADGYPDPPILGIPLDGTQSMAIRDTDGGMWDGDTVWDRAVGPMQFIPETWERWGADANGDGTADPNQIDDAALTAGRYLCASGPMSSVDGWRAAIFSYNNLETYVNDVASVANTYAARAAG